MVGVNRDGHSVLSSGIRYFQSIDTGTLISNISTCFCFYDTPNVLLLGVLGTIFSIADTVDELLLVTKCVLQRRNVALQRHTFRNWPDIIVGYINRICG